MKLFRRVRKPSEPTAPCPIRALCDKLNRRGWTVAMPFPIPDACRSRTCGHVPDDAWALDYVARAERVTRDVEDGRRNFQDFELLATTLFADGLPEDLRRYSG